MSQQTADVGSIPEWDLADRMRKTLRASDVGVQEIADYLEVSRNTVSTWINGRIVPSTTTLKLWAIRFGVPYEWLVDGVEPTTGPTHDDGTAAHVTSEAQVVNAWRNRQATVTDLATRRYVQPQPAAA